MCKTCNLVSLLFSLPLLIVQIDSANAETEIVGLERFVQVTEKGLTLEAVQVPLDRILAGIGELYDTPIALEGNLATPITLSFRDLSLQEAMRRLVGEATFMILHEPSSFEGAPARPSKIWVYGAVPGTRTVANDLSSMGAENSGAGVEADGSAVTDAEGAIPGEATQEVIEAMAERGEPEDLDALGRVVAEHPDVQMRYLAVTLLGDIHSDRAVLAIERGLGDEDPLFRSYLVETLGTNQALDAVRSLGRVLYGERNPEIRLIAVQNLALRDEEPVDVFLKVATVDSDKQVRLAAAKALGVCPESDCFSAQ